MKMFLSFYFVVEDQIQEIVSHTQLNQVYPTAGLPTKDETVKTT